MTHAMTRNTKGPTSRATRAATRATWALALALTMALGCSSHHDEDEGVPSGATCPSAGSTLTYENFGKAFMTSYCVSCHSSSLASSARHGAPSDHNFDTLANIKSTHVEHIDAEAAAGPAHVNTEMPPAGSPAPTEAERRQLGEWLACGTP